METILKIKHLSIAASHRHHTSLIKDINFALHKGETYALVGESGSGKSLTSLAIMQLLPLAVQVLEPSQILYGNQDLVRLSEYNMQRIRGRKIAMVFQEPMTSLNPVMTAGQQIIEVMRKHFKITEKAAKERTLELLNDVGLHDVVRQFSAYPHQLSGGMKQRIMIAMALAGQPEILIADEPTSALDVTTQAQILTLLKNIQKKYGMTLLFITHDLGVVKQIAHRVGMMYHGELVEEASVESFFANPQHPYSQKLFACIPTFAKRDSLLPTTDSQHNLTLIERACVTHKTMLNVHDLKIYIPIKKGIFRRTVGFIRAVDDLNFKLDEGKTLAIVGESGSGKTTLARALLKLIPITSGAVVIDQVNITGVLPRNDLRNFRRESQIVFQDPFSSMDPRMLVGDIILEGVRSLNLMTESEAENRLNDLLQKVGLPEDAKERYPHEFSGGQRQRIAIARALAVKPKFIICDEPTSALDVSIQAQILNLFKQLQQEKNLSYLFITHNMGVVAYMADFVAVMQEGKIVEQGTVYDILHRPQHAYTKRLLDAVPSLA